MEWPHGHWQIVQPVICDVWQILYQTVADGMTTVVDVVAIMNCIRQMLCQNVADEIATVDKRVPISVTENLREHS